MEEVEKKQSQRRERERQKEREREPDGVDRLFQFVRNVVGGTTQFIGDALERGRQITEEREAQRDMIRKYGPVHGPRVYEERNRNNNGCIIQSYQKQQEAYLHLSQFITRNLQNTSIKQVKQGLYLPSFGARDFKIDGKCVAITRGVSQALFLYSKKSFLSNLATSAKIYECIAQGKQVSKREEREDFAFSKLLNNFERQQDSATNSLPSSLISYSGL